MRIRRLIGCDGSTSGGKYCDVRSGFANPPAAHRKRRPPLPQLDSINLFFSFN
jgi:hypothetical protein